MSVFLELDNDEKLYNGDNFFLIKDRFPVSPGHILIISNRLKSDFFDLDENEMNELPSMIEVAKTLIEKDYAPDGYNIGMNCGETAGQTVFHFHCHVIPRFKGDMENPRGGIRHCIPEKGNY